MPYFCIFDHPGMPLVRASVEKRRRDSDKDGFRLRYVLQLSEGGEAQADRVIRAIDEAMGKATKAHGVYQARYPAVRAEYARLLEEAAAKSRPTNWSVIPRATAFVAASALFVVMCGLVPMVTIGFLMFSAVKKQSGFAAMAEAALIWHMLDWTGVIKRLFHYSIGRPW